MIGALRLTETLPVQIRASRDTVRADAIGGDRSPGLPDADARAAGPPVTPRRASPPLQAGATWLRRGRGHRDRARWPERPPLRTGRPVRGQVSVKRSKGPAPESGNRALTCYFTVGTAV